MICANPKCCKEFIPNIRSPKQKYCSVKCRSGHFYTENKVYVNKRNHIYSKKNKDSVNKHKKKWQDSNANKRKELETSRRKKLSNSYVANKLRRCGINPTTDKIEEKRLQIKIKRKIKQIQNENRKSKTNTL